MAKPGSFLLVSCLSYVLLICLGSVSAARDEDRKVYVVYMGALPSHGDYMPMSHHLNILQEVVGARSIENYLVRSYKRSFNGFAARLTESERERLASMDGVVSVFPNKKLKLQTTGSWDFMGLTESKTKHVPNLESNTIVGVIDSGIWPESASFDDEGFGPLPKKWKGACKGGKNFTCNNKLIGARYYTSGEAGKADSARDHLGHGTHTASTVAGNRVKGASFYGLAKGTARGGVSSARIAVYKVCDSDGCSSDGILSAFDDAIADHVDVITISIGGDYASPFEHDPLAIGAFHATGRGILTVNSAGNNGPKSGSVSSIAPWMLTVAASTTDRKFITKAVLGDGKTLVGRSVNSFDLNGTKYLLVYGETASSACDEASARFCQQGCLDSKLVKGKIVLCDSAKGYKEAHRAGAVGAIVKNTGDPDSSFVVSFPVSALTADDYESVLSYMNSAKNPKASVLKSEAVKNRNAPVVASFSSRGPNDIIDDILKPDITAPGLEILAAYSLDASPSSSVLDTRKVKYSVLSGTSMSCPHVAAIAAYLKTFHPRWSPSMVRSALMTTAWPMNASVNADAEFAYGSGHVDPIRAVHPGLVYETTKADYVALLCGMNYTGEYLRLISGDNITCTEELYRSLPRMLNYPSMTAKVSGQEPFKVTFRRTVTNVGLPNSTYKAKLVVGAGSKLSFKVVPSVLSFKSVYEKKSFTVTVSGKCLGTERLASASLVWSDGPHIVRSPIVVYT